MNIIQKPSENYNSRNGVVPDCICNHITASSTASSAYNWFQSKDNTDSSAHFIIDKDGTVYQCVSIQNMAWANGNSLNPSSSSYYKNAKSDIVSNRRMNANLYTVSIEHVCVSGGNLTSAQLQASIELHKYIISEVKRIYGVTIPANRQHILGHYQISPVNKPNCPGEDFPYDKIIAGLNPVQTVTVAVGGNTSNVTSSLPISLDTRSYQFPSIGNKYTFLIRNYHTQPTLVSSNPDIVSVKYNTINDSRGTTSIIKSLKEGVSYISTVVNGKAMGFLAGYGFVLDTHSKDMKVGQTYTVLAKCVNKPTVDITGHDVIDITYIGSDCRGYLFNIKAVGKIGGSHADFITADGHKDRIVVNVK